jgi:SAM-dependent methyltransferase
MNGRKNTFDPLYYSLRRQFVDELFFRHVPLIPPGSTVLDLGGNKILKRGCFDIEQYPIRTVYMNLSTAKRPDVQGNGSEIPFRDHYFDALVCSEVLEHVPSPSEVIREAHRVMRTGGLLLMCVPFLYPIHGDPQDYGRYTETYWKECLEGAGFTNVSIQRQGTYWSVLGDMLREWIIFQSARRIGPIRHVLRAIGRLIRRVVWLRDSAAGESEHPLYSKYTTGFGIIATKSQSQP